jgi:hypothetical protein
MAALPVDFATSWARLHAALEALISNPDAGTPHQEWIDLYAEVSAGMGRGCGPGGRGRWFGTKASYVVAVSWGSSL